MSSPSRKSVLIAGCGDLGTETGILFQALGYRVTGVRKRAELLPAGFEGQSVDLRADRPTIPHDLGVVVVALTASARTAVAYTSTYVDGLRNVLHAVSHSGLSPRVIFVSSTAVYGVGDGSRVDEQTDATGPTPTSAVLLEAEGVAVSSPFESCLLRLGGIYGPGRERLIEQVKRGDARLPLNSLFTNRIHRDDAARAIVHLAVRGDPMPTTVIGVDDEPAELKEVLMFLADELGLPAPLTGEQGDSAASNRRLSNALLRSTGFSFTYPTYREGYRAVLEGVGVRHP